MPNSFNSSDYVPALLQLLYDLDRPISADEMHNEFKRRYAANIPPSHEAYIPSGTLLRWIKNTDWARHVLKQIGLIESKGRGVSQISESGKQWVDDHGEVSWAGRRKSLWDKYNATRSSGKHRPASRKSLGDTDILAKIRPVIEQIESIVAGSIGIYPAAEIPGLIEFCYRMAMYEEGIVLFDKLDKSSLSQADFLRVKRVADACQLKLH